MIKRYWVNSLFPARFLTHRHRGDRLNNPGGPYCGQSVLGRPAAFMAVGAYGLAIQVQSHAFPESSMLGAMVLVCGSWSRACVWRVVCLPSLLADSKVLIMAVAALAAQFFFCVWLC